MKKKQYGLDITDRQDLVAICYTMWFNAIHGHGDLYYRWLCEYIRAYKAHEACPHLVQE